MKLKAINDVVLISPIKVGHTVGGLEIDSKSQGIRYDFGKVVTSSKSNIVNDGDFVYYDSNAGHYVKPGGDKYLVLRESDIVIIDEDFESQ